MGEQIRLTIQNEYHTKILRLRRFNRLIQSPEFGDAWAVSSVEEQGIVRKIIATDKYDKLQLWIYKILYTQFEKYTVKQLRILASRHHIRYYSRMLHGDLIRALDKKGVINDDPIAVIGRNEANLGGGWHTYQSDPTFNYETTSQDSYECL